MAALYGAVPSRKCPTKAPAKIQKIFVYQRTFISLGVCIGGSFTSNYWIYFVLRVFLGIGSKGN